MNPNSPEAMKRPEENDKYQLSSGQVSAKVSNS
jgi:hypothetical protein